MKTSKDTNRQDASYNLFSWHGLEWSLVQLPSLIRCIGTGIVTFLKQPCTNHCVPRSNQVHLHWI